jgi:hypothetical protein
MKRKQQTDQFYADFFYTPKYYLYDVKWCKSCELWIRPSHYEKGKPQYVHTCYDAKELRRKKK